MRALIARPSYAKIKGTPKLRRGSELGEDEADAADDVVCRGFVGGQGKELDGEVAGVGAEDETTFVEVDEGEE